MTHFAIICPAVTGHLNPMFALGHELQRRGHRVTFIGVLDAQATTLAAGLEFRAIGQSPRFANAESEYPLGAMPKLNAQLGELSGLPALRYAFSDFQKWNAVLLRDAPAAIREAGVEALLVDQVIPVRETLTKRMQPGYKKPFAEQVGLIELLILSNRLYPQGNLSWLKRVFFQHKTCERFQFYWFDNTLENNENTTKNIRITPCSANHCLS